VKKLKEIIKWLASCDSLLVRVYLSAAFAAARQSAEEGRNDKKYPTVNEKEVTAWAKVKLRYRI